VIRYISSFAQWLSLGLLALGLLIAPLAILGAIFFGPMG
jgi:hypothetical protein